MTPYYVPYYCYWYYLGTSTIIQVLPGHLIFNDIYSLLSIPFIQHPPPSVVSGISGTALAIPAARHGFLALSELRTMMPPPLT
ncbi:hypothetical protein BDV59DRAFT_181254 [Aspergillus ambiguus]|uniref:uncharacterized protein n=1 Tax=Aspergillus ambiguus TaxID=176160 RepID=UPI003CCE52C7